MIKFTPRFFVLPLIAFAVIASLPRHSAQTCVTRAAPISGIVDAGGADPAADCTPIRQQLVMAATRIVIR